MEIYANRQFDKMSGIVVERGWKTEGEEVAENKEDKI